jgi:hypothetical protein
MAKRRSSISNASTYQEMGEFWDTHDLTDYHDQTYEVEFEVDLQSERTYFPLEKSLFAKVRALAKQRGVTPETLLNLWVQEKLQEAA